MPGLELLRCPSCGSNLDEHGVDFARGIAKCAHCSALMRLPGVAPSAAQLGARERPELALPRNVTAVKGERGLELHRSWFRYSVMLLVPFLFAWNGFLVFWYARVATSNGPWIAAVFPIGHVAIGVGLTYFVLATLLNKTRIGFARGRLTVKHGPLPWPGNREIPTEQVGQLYCRSKLQASKRGTRETYSLWLLEKTGRRTKLLELGEEPDEALALEQRIERELGIRDAEVSGELPR